MAVIKSGSSTDQWTIDPASKAGRVSLYDASGNLITNTNPLSTKIVDSYKMTYIATFKAITPIASATNPFIVLTSNGNKTVKIWRIRFSATANTGTTGGDLWAAKFTAISGGTIVSTPVVAKALDTNPNPNVTLSVYSVVPTTATLADNFYFVERYVVVTGSATNPPEAVDYPFEDNNNNGAQPPTLTAAVPYFGIGLSVVGNTPVADVRIIWTEE